jgi:copper(I)-binding protein
MKHSSRFYIISIFTAIFVLTLTKYTLADDPAIYQSVEIKDAVLTPSKKGEMSTLRFYIRNEGIDPVSILGVKGPGHRYSKILAKVTDKNYVKLGSLPLAQEESLDLTSSHVLIQLTETTQSYKLNDTVPLTLVLINGELPFVAHVSNL